VSSVSLHQFLTLYSWFPLAALLLFLLLIARFYARFSGQRTYHWLYLVPMIGAGIVIVRLASTQPLLNAQPFSEDRLVIVTSLVSGLILTGLVIHLARTMLSDKPV
jgi:hypothetical protein